VFQLQQLSGRQLQAGIARLRGKDARMQTFEDRTITAVVEAVLVRAFPADSR